MDINNKKPIRDALKTEQEFFANHTLYRTIASRSGTSYLAKTLNRVLFSILKCDTLL